MQRQARLCAGPGGLPGAGPNRASAPGCSPSTACMRPTRRPGVRRHRPARPHHRRPGPRQRHRAVKRISKRAGVPMSCASGAALAAYLLFQPPCVLGHFRKTLRHTTHPAARRQVPPDGYGRKPTRRRTHGSRVGPRPPTPQAEHRSWCRPDALSRPSAATGSAADSPTTSQPAHPCLLGACSIPPRTACGQTASVVVRLAGTGGRSAG